MHFNPYSIALARDVVAAESESGRLRDVAVESCPSRWNATLDAQPIGSKHPTSDAALSPVV